METKTKTKTVRAASLVKGDKVVFFDTEYEIESCLVYVIGVEIIFKDTNDGEPYLYGQEDKFERVI